VRLSAERQVVAGWRRTATFRRQPPSSGPGRTS